MNSRRCAAFLFVLGAGCSTPEFYPSGSPTQPLGKFDRVDPALLQNGVPKKDPPPVEAPPSPDAFLTSFRKDLVARLHKKGVFNLPSGPLLLLEGTLLRYERAARKPGSASDTNLFAGFVDIDIVLKDEKGARIFGGRASVTGTGPTPDLAILHAERRAVWVIADVLRRQTKKGSNKADPDEP